MRDAARLAERAAGRDRHAVARCITLLEDDGDGSRQAHDGLLAELDERERAGSVTAPIVGLTGAPGCGKSTLVAAVTSELLDRHADLTLAVVSVDPSSAVTGGALLGDRTRLRDDGADRRYFRSQSSHGTLGGLAPSTFAVCRFLRLVYDLVIVETVGSGQSDLDVHHLADHLFLVLPPLSGDELQYLKAGIMEVPDEIVVNKADEPAAAATVAQLRAGLSVGLAASVGGPPIHVTSAHDGTGVDGLADAIDAARLRQPAPATERARQAHFLECRVGREWGAVGRRFLAHLGGAGDLLAGAKGYAEAQRRFDAELRVGLSGGGWTRAIDDRHPHGVNERQHDGRADDGSAAGGGR